MAAFERYAYDGGATPTTILASVDTVDTVVSIADATSWPTGAPFFVLIDLEILSKQEKCVATRSGTTLTLTRGQDGTVASAHDAGASIKPIFSAVEADAANTIASTMTTKGDVIVTNGSVLNRLAVGTDAHVLTADAASTNGLKWATPTYDEGNAILLSQVFG